MGQQPSQSTLSPQLVTVATVESKATVITGEVGDITVEVMFDSGSAVSLLRKRDMDCMKSLQYLKKIPQVKLITASGDPLPIVDHVQTMVRVGNFKTAHEFVVVECLIYPVILGIDFLQQNELMLDFTSVPVSVCRRGTKLNCTQQMEAMWHSEIEAKSKRCAATIAEDPSFNMIDECSIPQYGNPVKFDVPCCDDVEIDMLLMEYKDLFRSIPGVTKLAYHHIPTAGNPVRVPPRRVPAHYKEEVEHQIQQMLQEGIIEESSSPWMAPAVFVQKKSGEIRLCVDYRELNKKTQKDAYPLPLPDEVQDKLAGSTIFSTLDLQSGYWQLPVNPEDCYKTAFCPGPGMGLFQFQRMPFGLTGAPSSFQRLMNQIFRGLPFVTTYVDDILIHSADKNQHLHHLREVLSRLRQANLTLRGRKCQICMSEVPYLGHVFSGKGMSPDKQKVSAVEEWPTPQNVAEVRKFLGLASYYRRYILHFSDIAKPLHQLTQKDAKFVWSSEHTNAFSILKKKLVQAPILAYPQFKKGSPHFVLQTDASSVGLGAVLEQNGHVIAYASRSLNKAEQQYSVIQKECLAAVFAMKQFRHYLLGRPFHLLTDHCPLQWLSSQKMEGLLCRWALAMQEYDFTIKYRKGCLNANADALSRCIHPPISAATTKVSTDVFKANLKAAQQEDPVIRQIFTALQTSQKPTPRKWRRPPLLRFRQLWTQLIIVDGVVCRKYSPGPLRNTVTVPVIPSCMQQQLLHQCHDSPAAGHQGVDKTMEHLRGEGYWVNMHQHVERYCRECTKCQKSKLPQPSRAPLTSIPIGKPWQMVAIDILTVPLSSNGNKYLLVVQDYFTKWADAIPLPNQSASTITSALIKLFSTMGMPDIVHSDQGRNFESEILKQCLEAFGISKSHTTAYHPEGDGMVERFNRSLLQLLRSYTDVQSNWEEHLPLALYAYRTAIHASTGASPYTLMFGRQPHSAVFESPCGFDPTSYQFHLRDKLAKLRDFVESNLVMSSANQKMFYDHRAHSRSFHVNDNVWLSIPTAGKLDPKWEGKWKITSLKSPVNVEIFDGKRRKVVHINRLQHRLQPMEASSHCDVRSARPWCPPQIEHFSEQSSSEPRRNPPRNRHPPDYYRPG